MPTGGDREIPALGACDTLAECDALARRADVVCGGFPCQSVSTAGSRDGIAEGTASGLWEEMRRIIREVRPPVALIENVPGLFSLGFERVLGDLASIGYDAEWTVLSPADLGAPHDRPRIFIVAYPNCEGEQLGAFDAEISSLPATPDTISHAAEYQATRYGQHGREVVSEPEPTGPYLVGKGWWSTQSPICRVDDGVPHQLDRLKCLGNAVVPQCAEMIGRAILRALGE